MTIEAPEPLRDTIEKAFDASQDVAPEPVQVAEPVAPVTEAPFVKEDATGRLHGEGGKFVPKEPPAQPTEPVVERKRPNTWKKDYWEAYDKLATENPQLADYILQREAEYTKGVSTYKQEWDRAKPFLDAIAPFEPTLRQYNLDPAKHTAALMAAHQQLVLGSPEQKLAMFARLAADYKVPLGNLLTQAEDGKWYLQQPQVPQPQISQQDIQQQIQSSVQQALTEQQITAEVEAFKQSKPYFEEIRGTMAQLLDAGIAKNLQEAEQIALRMPQHEHLNLKQQQQQGQDDARKRAEAARRNAVSPRSATPAAQAPIGKKDLRSTIESAFDEHVAGRV